MCHVQLIFCTVQKPQTTTYKKTTTKKQQKSCFKDKLAEHFSKQ